MSNPCAYCVVNLDGFDGKCVGVCTSCCGCKRDISHLVESDGAATASPVTRELDRERDESDRWRGLYEMRVAAHRREKERALAALGEVAELREKLDEYEVEPGEGTEFQRIADRMIAPSDGISWKPLLDLLAERDRLRAQVAAAERFVIAMGPCDNLSAEDDWTTGLCAEPGCVYCDLARALGDGDFPDEADHG